MSVINDVLRLLEETPKYMTHITIGRWILERLLNEISDLKARIKELETKK